MTIRVAVQETDIGLGAELARLEQSAGGAIASFTGLVRADGDMRRLELETYAGMAVTVLEAVAHTAAARWSLLGATIIHRHGSLAISDRIVPVAAAAPHRAAALEASSFLIDWTKTKGPFWKRELLAGGRGRRVEARDADQAAADAWDAA